MKLYNTLTRSLQPFEPLHPPAVTMYVCGPTVYDVPHIGHARSAYIFDVLRRYLAYQQFNVTFVRNVTDVDDKIIQKAREELARPGGHEGRAGGTEDLQAKCREVAERSLKSYHDALARLSIQPPDEEPKATEHVLPDDRHIDASMTGFIAQLLVKGSAYEAGGDVYFAVRKFPGYGKLSNRSIDELQSGARVEPGEHKQDPLDFALWKAVKPDEPSWNSPWGKGRPAWHIECSVMSTRYLGDAFDIHGGGVDLVFPHHENEIAQAQALGKPFAKYWVHNGLLTVNGEKMSKSLGNYITVEDSLKQCAGKSDILKIFFLGAHYRSPVDYSAPNIKAATKRFDNLFHFVLVSQNRNELADKLTGVKEIDQLEEEFKAAMDNDLNTPQALAVLDKLANYGWQLKIDLAAIKMSEQERRAARGRIALAGETVRSLADVLGLQRLSNRVEIPEDIWRLVAQREEARGKRDFETADRLRNEINEKGYLVEDGARESVMVFPKP